MNGERGSGRKRERNYDCYDRLCMTQRMGGKWVTEQVRRPRTLPALQPCFPLEERARCESERASARERARERGCSEQVTSSVFSSSSLLTVLPYFAFPSLLSLFASGHACLPARDRFVCFPLIHYETIIICVCACIW